jgi:hypothetical protein
MPTGPDDLTRPLTKRAVSQVRPSLIVDATAPAALLTVAAEAISFVRLRNGRCGADIRSRFGEVGDAVLRWLMSPVVRGGAECGKAELGNCQSKNESHWALDRNAHFNLLSSNRRRRQSVFTSAASPSSAIGVCIAIVLLRRLRFREIYSRFFKRFCCDRHRERSGAIQGNVGRPCSLDCFVAALLATTIPSERSAP